MKRPVSWFFHKLNRSCLNNKYALATNRLARWYWSDRWNQNLRDCNWVWATGRSNWKADMMTRAGDDCWCMIVVDVCHISSVLFAWCWFAECQSSKCGRTLSRKTWPSYQIMVQWLDHSMQCIIVLQYPCQSSCCQIARNTHQPTPR